MASPRIFCDLRLGPGAQFSLPQDAANHVGRALRLRAGDALVVFDGRGGEFEAVIQRIDRDRVDVKTGAFSDADRESPIEVGLVQGLPEADKMDWTLQKSVELGVAWVQPVVCERSVVRLSGDRAARRESHWQRVVIAACEQCGRNRLPELRPTLAFRDWAAQPSTARRWMLAPGADESLAGQPAPAGPVELLVGPEGGLSERELDIAAMIGFASLSLGPRVLRTETAPLAALSAMQALWGDFRR
ncbi:MAG TPA: 16S rRNA (uracil(1498)-N(3))-methyltransferase [Usitatibacteraceae bacterium]|nr:16S rRNA (uracil(1498)-N(3))-methyltransferase [Usitatibacteraceae bacterium]